MNKKERVEIESNNHIKTDADIITDRTDESPVVVRLELTNELSRTISIHTGLPFPISGTRAAEAPVPAHLVPTADHVRERNLNGPSEPYHLEEIGGEECWVREDGYGGVDTLAAQGIRAEETETFDFALVVDPNAEECLSPGDYVFEAELGVSHPPEFEVLEWLTWQITVEIA